MTKMIMDKPGSFVEVVTASWRDFNAVREIESQSFDLDAWPLIDIIGVLTLPSVIRLKAVVDGEIVGFIAVDIRRSQGVAWIATIAVHPDHRRKGIGGKLLEEAEAQSDLAHMRLTVRRSNRPAINLYHNFGYREVDIWPRYYKGGEDGIVMEKRIVG
jgi:ribosomal-protein-alanine N-acetyltransferase